jgi:hypothetical protein
MIFYSTRTSFHNAITLLLLGCGCQALVSDHVVTPLSHCQFTKEKLDTPFKSRSLYSHSKGKKNACDPCAWQESLQETDLDMDRREAFFALMGNAWAIGLLPTMLDWTRPPAALAAFGADAKIELPDLIQGITDRSTKQCLVESLGSRQCLVYADEGNKLYQGVDSQELLQKIDKASLALANLPDLIESRKWSQVLGVMTGPMGDLVRVMGQIADLSENATASKARIKTFREQLYAISAAVERKDGEKALKFHATATDELVAFVKSL